MYVCVLRLNKNKGKRQSFWLILWNTYFYGKWFQVWLGFFKKKKKKGEVLSISLVQENHRLC